MINYFIKNTSRYAALKDRIPLYQHIYDEIHAKYPDYELHITLDIDVSD